MDDSTHDVKCPLCHPLPIDPSNAKEIKNLDPYKDPILNQGWWKDAIVGEINEWLLPDLARIVAEYVPDMIKMQNCCKHLSCIGMLVFGQPEEKWLFVSDCEEGHVQFEHGRMHGISNQCWVEGNYETCRYVKGIAHGLKILMDAEFMVERQLYICGEKILKENFVGGEVGEVIFKSGYDRLRWIELHETRVLAQLWRSDGEQKYSVFTRQNDGTTLVEHFEQPARSKKVTPRGPLYLFVDDEIRMESIDTLAQDMVAKYKAHVLKCNTDFT